MFGKKQAVLTAAICAVIFSLMAPVGPAHADTITDTAVILNDQGVLVPSGYDPETLVVSRVEPAEVAGSPFRVVSPLIEIQFMLGGSNTDLPARLTYVFFNMNKTERLAWDLGQAGIFYRAGTSGAWTACSSTHLVTGENPPYGRLACIAPQSAVYGLGILETPAELLPGAQVEPGIATASYLTDSVAQTGNQGVFAPSGLDLNRIAVRLVAPGLESIPDMPFEVRRSLVRIDWIGDQLPVILTQGQDPEDMASAEPAAPVNLLYVFFILDNVSRRLLDDGTLSIYFYNQIAGAWEVCPTMLIAQGDHGTVSCIASQFTYYALAITSGFAAVSAEE